MQFNIIFVATALLVSASSAMSTKLNFFSGAGCTGKVIDVSTGSKPRDYVLLTNQVHELFWCPASIKFFNFSQIPSPWVLKESRSSNRMPPPKQKVKTIMGVRGHQRVGHEGHSLVRWTQQARAHRLGVNMLEGRDGDGGGAASAPRHRDIIVTNDLHCAQISRKIATVISFRSAFRGISSF
ncbi:hypothetical protein B0H13DRAFT_1868575 [Mycena leptocephala]|nr:hypothetical protein B0H13DRAFT_1868575 [Mycena leptocephala]